MFSFVLSLVGVLPTVLRAIRIKVREYPIMAISLIISRRWILRHEFCCSASSFSCSPAQGWLPLSHFKFRTRENWKERIKVTVGRGRMQIDRRYTKHEGNDGREWQLKKWKEGACYVLRRKVCLLLLMVISWCLNRTSKTMYGVCTFFYSTVGKTIKIFFKFYFC